MTHADPNAAPPGPPHDTQTETHSEPRDHADAGHDAGSAQHAGGGHDAGGHDEHGHAEEALGPVNWQAWGAGALGLLVAAVMVLVFAIATEAIPIG